MQLVESDKSGIALHGRRQADARYHAAVLYRGALGSEGSGKGLYVGAGLPSFLQSCYRSSELHCNLAL